MALLTPSADALQDLINVCQVCAAKHDIVYNTTNTQCMVLVPLARSKVNYLESAQLSGRAACGVRRALTFVDRFTYLGHVLYRDMTGDAVMSSGGRPPTLHSRLTQTISTPLASSRWEVRPWQPSFHATFFPPFWHGW